MALASSLWTQNHRLEPLEAYATLQSRQFFYAQCLADLAVAEHVGHESGHHADVAIAVLTNVRVLIDRNVATRAGACFRI